MTSQNKVITLIEPIEGHGNDKIETLTLRAPKFQDVMLLGEPSAFARSEGGIMFTSEKDDVIEAYIRRLLIEPKDTGLLAQLCLGDTIQLRNAIFDFFNAARETIRAQQQS